MLDTICSNMLVVPFDTSEQLQPRFPPPLGIKKKEGKKTQTIALCHLFQACLLITTLHLDSVQNIPGWMPI